MAGWASNNQKMSSGESKENDMFMGALLNPKSGIDLMQNCDLPPPLKVFSGSDRTVMSSMNRVFSMMGREDDADDGKLELLKALSLSQTRAREAERKAANLAEERDSVSNALLRESLELFAYRQWVRLLQVQVLKLQQQWQQEGRKVGCNCGRSEGKDCQDGDEVSWIVALAFCLGIAGVGIVLGCRYLF